MHISFQKTFCLTKIKGESYAYSFSDRFPYERLEPLQIAVALNALRGHVYVLEMRLKRLLC